MEDLLEKLSSSALQQLLRAKRESDRNNYAKKHKILRKLLANANQGDFVIDQDRGDGILGLTYTPSNFRIHIPAGVVPDMSILGRMPVQAPVKTAARFTTQAFRGGLPVTPRPRPQLTGGLPALNVARPADLVGSGSSAPFRPVQTLAPMPGPAPVSARRSATFAPDSSAEAQRLSPAVNYSVPASPTAPATRANSLATSTAASSPGVASAGSTPAIRRPPADLPVRRSATLAADSSTAAQMIPPNADLSMRSPPMGILEPNRSTLPRSTPVPPRQPLPRSTPVSPLPRSTPVPQASAGSPSSLATLLGVGGTMTGGAGLFSTLNDRYGQAPQGLPGVSTPTQAPTTSTAPSSVQDLLSVLQPAVLQDLFSAQRPTTPRDLPAQADFSYTAAPLTGFSDFGSASMPSSPGLEAPMGMPEPPPNVEPMVGAFPRSQNVEPMVGSFPSMGTPPPFVPTVQNDPRVSGGDMFRQPGQTTPRSGLPASPPVPGMNMQEAQAMYRRFVSPPFNLPPALAQARVMQIVQQFSAQNTAARDRLHNWYNANRQQTGPIR